MDRRAYHDGSPSEDIFEYLTFLRNPGDWERWSREIEGFSRAWGVWDYVNPDATEQPQKPGRPELPTPPVAWDFPKRRVYESNEDFQVRFQEFKFEREFLNTEYDMYRERYRVDCQEYSIKLTDYTKAMERLSQLNIAIYATCSGTWRDCITDQSTATPQSKLRKLRESIRPVDHPVGDLLLVDLPVDLPTNPSVDPYDHPSFSLSADPSVDLPADQPGDHPADVPVNFPAKLPVQPTVGPCIDHSGDSVVNQLVRAPRREDSRFKDFRAVAAAQHVTDWEAWTHDFLVAWGRCNKQNDPRIDDEARMAFLDAASKRSNTFFEKWRAKLDVSAAQGTKPIRVPELAGEFRAALLREQAQAPGARIANGLRQKPPKGSQKRSLESWRESVDIQSQRSDSQNQSETEYRKCPGCLMQHLVKPDAWWETCFVYHQLSGKKEVPSFFYVTMASQVQVEDWLRKHPKERELADEWEPEEGMDTDRRQAVQDLVISLGLDERVQERLGQLSHLSARRCDFVARVPLPCLLIARAPDVIYASLSLILVHAVFGLLWLALGVEPSGQVFGAKAHGVSDDGSAELLRRQHCCQVAVDEHMQGLHQLRRLLVIVLLVRLQLFYPLLGAVLGLQLSLRLQFLPQGLDPGVERIRQQLLVFQVGAVILQLPLSLLILGSLRGQIGVGFHNGLGYQGRENGPRERQEGFRVGHVFESRLNDARLPLGWQRGLLLGGPYLMRSKSAMKPASCPSRRVGPSPFRAPSHARGLFVGAPSTSTPNWRHTPAPRNWAICRPPSCASHA
ncbi:hypothetical protein TOPH_05245 [Tolypocladium ophioglossoides CBS 100239]|uniref:Uncharacterized protein n=1 Tax=Tolypocladium ophioglossoides (strain CBS 100239) TaxID=1163406 RepID=A0A0L0N8K8_TOLOC|nr:hypothetical protein TOPH_05245 [Tolypocladium ophioglossoides CBS 100239]